MRGGKRTGAGRTKAPPKRITTIRFTTKEHADYMAAGGARWLRRMIAELKALNETR